MSGGRRAAGGMTAGESAAKWETSLPVFTHKKRNIFNETLERFPTEFVATKLFNLIQNEVCVFIYFVA